MRYIMTNDKGEVLEDNTKDKPIQYVHGSGNILPLLEQSLNGLKCGETKTVFLPGEHARGSLYLDVIIDEVRVAEPAEIEAGKPLQQALNNDCGPGCCC